MGETCNSATSETAKQNHGIRQDGTTQREGGSKPNKYFLLEKKFTVKYLIKQSWFKIIK